MNPIAEILAPTALPNAAGVAARAQSTSQVQGSANDTDTDFANVLAAFRTELGLDNTAANDQPTTNTLLSSTANVSVTTPVANVAATSLLALDATAQATTPTTPADTQGQATVDATAMLAALAGMQTTLQQMQQQPTEAVKTAVDATAAVQTNAAGLRGTITIADAQIIAQAQAQATPAAAAQPAQAAQAQTQTAQATPAESDAATANVLASLAAQAPAQPTETKQLQSASPIAKPAPAKAPKQAQPHANTHTTQTAQPSEDKTATKSEGNASTVATSATSLPPAGVAPSTDGSAQAAQPQTNSSTSAQTAAAQHVAVAPVVTASASTTTVIEAQQLGAQVSAQAQAGVGVDSLAVHIARKFEAGSNEFSIRLHPAELGQLDISLSMADDGHVQAVLRAERPETLDMLQKDARVLEQQLRQAGLEVGSNSLSFSLSTGGGEREAPFKGWPGYADAGEANGSAKPEAASAYIAVRARDGLDIRV